jgi:hypothetical protein
MCRCWRVFSCPGPFGLHLAVHHHHHHHDSSPGPDGISLKIWKAIPDLCTPISSEICHQLSTMNADALLHRAPEFNEAFLCCLGKAPSGSNSEGNLFKTSSTRPLSVVNADNRLIANAFRLKLAPIMASWNHGCPTPNAVSSKVGTCCKPLWIWTGRQCG